MTLLLVVVASMLAAGGLLLVMRGLLGVTTPLPTVMAELARPRTQTAVPSLASRVRARLVGKRTEALQSDLTVVEKSDADYVTNRLMWSTLGGMPGVFAVLGVLAGVTTISLLAALGLMAVGAVGGFVYARQDLATDAKKARAEFRHALASFLELVTILMAGGAGVETSLFEAATTGEGRAFRHLRAALSTAQTRRQAPWDALGELGRRLRVPELEELEASMTLAGQGAQVRESLMAKAAGIKAKDLGEVEATAEKKSESMLLIGALMFFAFFVFVGYPAFAGLSGI